MILACPIDNKDDAIQKVSAVVSGGQSTGTFSGPTGGTVSYDGKTGSVSGYTTLSGTSTSRLAQLLAPPPPPIKPSGLGCWWILIWYPIMPFLIVFSALVPIMIITAIFSEFGEYVNSNDFSIVSLTAKMAVFVFGVSTIIIFWISGRFWFRQFKNYERRKIEREDIVYRKEKPKWDNAMRVWDRLYYCHKHDIVFDPENGEYCSPSTLNDFFYQSKAS